MGGVSAISAQHNRLHIYIRSAVYSLLRPIDRLLQILIPPDHGKYCYTSFPDYSDNSFYIYRYLLRNRNDIEHVWLVRNMAIKDRLMQEFQRYTSTAATTGNALRVVHRHSLGGYLHFLRSSFVFHTHGIYGFSNWAFRRNIICLWHGMPIKCVGRLNYIAPNPFPDFGTTHISTSSFFKYIVACAFNAKAESVLVSGLPRCDALRFEDEVDTPKPKLMELLGISPDNKFILWMPTFRTETVNLPANGAIRSFLDDTPKLLLAELDNACGLLGCTVLVKLHPNDLMRNKDSISEFSNIKMLTAAEWEGMGIKLYDLVAASDALITDVSSVLIDYMATSKPIGILGFDKKSYTRDLAFPVEWIYASSRVSMLSNRETVDRFLRKTTEPQMHVDHSDDVSLIFIKESNKKYSELIASELGL